MPKHLIIVESPAKIKTLQKFLGPDYIFESSLGHVRDLPEREFGIDLENIEPKYTILPDKEQVIQKLKKAAKEADTIYLSPDPDREGEAIAWHITQVLPANSNIKRVSFNSITKEAVLKALENPREIDIALVNAQQARRLLDRIVGYKISPILNRRIQRGKEGSVSAGRVQSVTLKLVVDREKEIEIFIPVEYWNLGALFRTDEHERSFKTYLYSVDGKKVEKEAVDGKEVMLISNKEEADKIVERLQKGPYEVISVDKKEKKRNPVAPFITSTLQQEASRHYGFSSSRTMGIAQGLYEGIDLGKDGAEGLITYMRTDSVRIAPEAVQEAKSYIQAQYGEQYVPAQPKAYSQQKSAQDAHEAIRPASLEHSPESIQPYLSREQFMLYQLIWRRFLASQMVPAVYDTVVADIQAGENVVMRATGSVIKFPGFLAAYEEKFDDEEKSEESRMLPPLEEGQHLNLIDLLSEQAFTRPPPRFTEASLVKELEKSGIGRPSTYATIMNKIQSRDYTIKESGRLKPTELGRVIAELLENNFQQIMNIDFTALMEDSLEKVAENEQDWKTLIKDFWEQFCPILETAEKNAFVPKILTDLECPLCHSKLQKVWFKSKYFYGCSGYPECTYTAQTEEINFNKDDYAEDFDWEQKCPNCQGETKIRFGRFGPFLGCLKYPECKGIINIPKKGEAIIAAEDLPPCPAIDCPGHMVMRKSRFGKTFFSCSSFPECDVIVNDLEQLASKYPEHPRTAYIAKPKKGAKAKAGKASKTAKASTTVKSETAAKKTKKAAKKEPKEKKEKAPRKQTALKLTKELEAIVGAPELARTEVTKKLWDYIKLHQLQSPANKRLIVPDDLLAKVFHTKEPVDMFKMTSLVNAHMQKE